MSSKEENTRHAGDFAEKQHDGRTNEHCQLPVLSGNYTPEQIERAHRTYAEAVQWIAENPSAWEFMNTRFVELGERGRKFTIQRIIEEVRDRGDLVFSSTNGGRLAISHSYRSVFSRLLCKAHPQYRHLVKTCDTVFDHMGESWAI